MSDDEQVTLRLRPQRTLHGIDGFSLYDGTPDGLNDWSSVLLAIVAEAAAGPVGLPGPSLLVGYDKADLIESHCPHEIEGDPLLVFLVWPLVRIAEPNFIHTVHKWGAPAALGALHPDPSRPLLAAPPEPFLDNETVGSLLVPGVPSIGLEHQAVTVTMLADRTVVRVATDLRPRLDRDPDLAALSTLLP